MKFRKLIKRGVIRYFQDDHEANLWRWAAGKMQTHNGDGWNPSVRLPHVKHYENGWKEISEKHAKKIFPHVFGMPRLERRRSIPTSVLKAASLNGDVSSPRLVSASDEGRPVEKVAYAKVAYEHSAREVGDSTVKLTAYTNATEPKTSEKASIFTRRVKARVLGEEDVVRLYARAGIKSPYESQADEKAQVPQEAAEEEYLKTS